MKFKIQSEQERNSLHNYIDKLSTEKTWEVTIVQKKKKRSVSQNALYHMWLNCIAKDTGNDIEGIADEFKRRYLGYRIVEVFDEERKILKSTTTLTTEEFTIYLSQIQMFCETELGIILPNPEDKFFEQFTEQYDL